MIETLPKQENEQTNYIDHLEIINLLANENWKLALEKITSDMDPWNIDLEVLSKRFSQYLSEIKNYDMQIPAKMILLAAIIYRLKSEDVKVFPLDKKNQIYEEEDFFEEIELDESKLKELIDQQNTTNDDVRIISLPEIKLPILKKEFTRKVTIYELIDALDKALKEKKKEVDDEFFEQYLKNDDFNIEDLIEETYKKIKLATTTKPHTSYFELTQKYDKLKKIQTLQSILYLVFDKKINAWQEEHFGDIKISLKEKTGESNNDSTN